MRSWQPKGKPDAVFALDLRRCGKSEGERFYVENISEYFADVLGMIAIAKERYPGLPVYLLGHSAGGVVSCTHPLTIKRKLMD